MTDMKEIVQGYRDRIAHHKEKIVSLDKAIRSIQNVCEHDWEYSSSDFDKEVHECIVCGKHEWR